MANEFGNPRTLFRLIQKQHMDGKLRPTCEYCGHVFSESLEGYMFMSVDHWKPQNAQEQGVHDFKNLRLSCKLCNSTKNSRKFEENSDEYRLFKEDRVLVRHDDIRWVKEILFAHKDLPAFLDDQQLIALQDDMFELMKQDKINFPNVAIYNRSKKWLQWGNPNRLWRFSTLKNNYLQPYFVLKMEKDSKVNKWPELDRQGFRFSNSRLKFIPPFVSPDSGIGFICKSVQNFEELVLLKKGDARFAALQLNA